MKLNIKALILLGVIVAVASFFFFMPRQAAPDTVLTTIDGEKIQLADLKGKPYLVVFWATDCSGCVQEIPELVQLTKEQGPDNFPVIAIAMPHDNLDAIRTMRANKQMNYKIAFDQDGSLSKAFGGVKLTPTNFLIAPNGDIVLSKIGAMDMNDLKQRVQALKAG